MSPLETTHRVLMIGIDGATFRIIRPLVESGRMPTFARIMSEGCYGVAESTMPPITAPAWAAFLTGKNPGKTGVFDFARMRPGTYDIELVNATSIRSKTIWHLLSDAGRRVISLNVPMTYPPYEVNGVLISGVLTPPGTACTVSPRLRERLEAMGYIIDMSAAELIHKGGDVEVRAMARRRYETARALMTSEPWDVMVVVFVSTDRLQHKCWHRMEVIEAHYTEIDGYIAGLMAAAGPETTVLIVSDHGFAPMPRTFYVNEWLASAGLAVCRRAIGGSIRESGKISADMRARRRSTMYRLWRSTMYRLLRATGFTREVRGRLVPNRLWQRIRKFIPDSMRGVMPSQRLTFDWSRTRAFGSYVPVIHVNRKGLRPEGTVGDDEYDVVVEEIRRRLREVVDPATGQRPFVHVHRGSEIYSGPWFGEGPDIIFRCDDMRYSVSGQPSPQGLFADSPPGSGFHDLDGIFAAMGPLIAPKGQLPRLRLIDLAPTVLHIAGVGVPSDVDGRVLSEILRPETEPARRPVRSQGPSALEGEICRPTLEEGQAEVAERLRGLGYFD